MFPNHKELRTQRKKHKKEKRSELVKLFKSSEENFNEFVSEYPDKFVIAVIDIMLDKSAVSEAETDLETMLFHEFRGSPDLWLDLQTQIKKDLKRKLLVGVNELEGSDRKILILAHIIAIVSTFEEWDELVPGLTDFNSSKEGKLKILSMIAAWKPDRFKVHSLQIAKVIYPETLKIDDSNISSFEALSLFRILDPIMKNLNDTPLAMQIMKSTMAFLLKLYVRNYQELALFDSNSNVNLNKSIFNEMDCNIEESFESAKICFGLLHSVQFHHFAAIPLELRDELFFLSNVFLKISAEKVMYGVTVFPETRAEWEEEEWHFACVANEIFSVFVGWNSKEKAAIFDYFGRYFKTMNDDFNLIENIVSNINYDIDESVWSFWPNVLRNLAADYVHYFWQRTDLFLPLLAQKHPSSACLDLYELRTKCYNQEWLAVRWFVRTNYEKLYNQLRIPIMEIILKYLSRYLATDIYNREDNEIYAGPPGLEVEYDVPAIKDDYDSNSVTYNVMNEMMSEYKKECLISGFVKTLKSIKWHIVPETISSMIYAFYPWIIEQFETYNKNDFELQNENTLIKLTKADVDRTVYGRINIGPRNTDIHEWTFKVLSVGQISFGIDESDCKMLDSGFLAPSETRSHYSYAFTGGKYNMDKNYMPYGERYGTNDVITMVLDANERTLRFYKNGIYQKINADGIDLSKTFKMAVGLCFLKENAAGCSAQLISYKCASATLEH